MYKNCFYLVKIRVASSTCKVDFKHILTSVSCKIDFFFHHSYFCWWKEWPYWKSSLNLQVLNTNRRHQNSIASAWVGSVIYLLPFCRQLWLCDRMCRSLLRLPSTVSHFSFKVLNYEPIKGIFFFRYLYMFQYPAVFLRTVTWSFTFCTLFRICSIPTGLCTVDPWLSRLQPWQMNKKRSTTRLVCGFFQAVFFVWRTRNGWTAFLGHLKKQHIAHREDKQELIQSCLPNQSET